MVRLDHLSYAVDHEGFVATAQYLGARLGVTFVDGGVHPRFGTRNLVLPLAGGTYIDVVTPLDHPSADHAAFGQAVRRRACSGGGWLSWVLAVDDIDRVAERLGQSPAEGRRTRPDGVRLQWRHIGVLDGIVNPPLPFFVQWLSVNGGKPFPGGRDDIWVDRLELAGDNRSVQAWLGAAEGERPGPVNVTWVYADEPGLVAAHFATPNGTVRID